MVCRSCRFQFCWVCLQDWDVHGYNQTVCNSYIEPPPTAEHDAARDRHERWQFYYTRFENHEKSAVLEQDLIERTKEKMLELQATSKLTWIETQFMQDAVERLTACRESLKWTYAMAYFLEKGSQKDIFEGNQA